MSSSESSNSGVAASGDGGQEKQKMLLSSETGHFSLVRALHLADLVTELNGKICKNNIIRPLMLTAFDRILWRQDRNVIISKI
ncbi:CDP-diacylglycerol-serine O-phosphatidyltransferase [Aspergillus fumigatus]